MALKIYFNLKSESLQDASVQSEVSPVARRIQDAVKDDTTVYHMGLVDSDVGDFDDTIAAALSFLSIGIGPSGGPPDIAVTSAALSGDFFPVTVAYNSSTLATALGTLQSIERLIQVEAIFTATSYAQTIALQPITIRNRVSA